MLYFIPYFFVNCLIKFFPSEKIKNGKFGLLIYKINNNSDYSGLDSTIHSGTDQYGYPAYGDIYEYQNRLLKTKTEKGNDGTITSVTTYSYEFFE